MRDLICDVAQMHGSNEVNDVGAPSCISWPEHAMNSTPKLYFR